MRLGSYYRRLVLQHLGVNITAGPVLDLGSYDGSALAGLSDLPVVGLDLQPAPAGQCALLMVRGDGRRPPFRAGSFATIFALDVLEHEEDDRGLAAVLLELLAPGGALWLSVPHREYRAVPGMATGLLHRRWGHVRPGYTEEELAILFGAGVDLNVIEWNEPAFRLLYGPVWMLWRFLPALGRFVLRGAARWDAGRSTGRSGHLFARIVRNVDRTASLGKRDAPQFVPRSC